MAINNDMSNKWAEFAAQHNEEKTVDPLFEAPQSMLDSSVMDAFIPGEEQLQLQPNEK